jgi:hypothetical protein
MSPYVVLQATRLLRRLRLLHVADGYFRNWTLLERQACWHLELPLLELWLTIHGLSRSSVLVLQSRPPEDSLDQLLLESSLRGIQRTVSVTLMLSRPWWVTSARSWT